MKVALLMLLAKLIDGGGEGVAIKETKPWRRRRAEGKRSPK